MEIIEGFDSIASLEEMASRWERIVVAMGNFDGVHLGHQEILGHAVRSAEKIEGVSVCFTFRPHPLKVLHPEFAPRMIHTFGQKFRAIEEAGIQVLFVQNFDLAFSRLGYDEFFRRYLLDALKPHGLRVGYNFAFGHERQGNIANLQQMCAQSGIEFHAIGEVGLDRDSSEKHPLKINSSQIRKLLENGEIKVANRMLGQAYKVMAEVVHGEGRGKKVGFATANLRVENDRLIPRGVYACQAHMEGPEGQAINAVANLGVRPTFSEDNAAVQAEVLEVHLLDFTGEIYGETLEVSFLDFLRPEKKFSDANALKKQILTDIQTAQRVFKNFA